ncbi:hypothetical protein ABZW10_24500 [Kitasatospora sp. NPDC004723]|uniref:hypothetical protein n=1 Tax=Kitasatospora sp. NPDC004723 TaxID=3154288 RepID=UPI0033A1A4BC
MTEPQGPTMAGGTQAITSQGYYVTFFPDANNFDLIKEGKSPHYYYLPTQLRIARRDGEKGDFKFSLLRFIGGITNPVREGSGNGGESGAGPKATGETVGGLLSLTTTGTIPAAAMQEAQQQIVKNNANSSNGLWNHKNLKPEFSPVVLMSNNTTLSNITLTHEGFRYFVQDKDGGVPELVTQGDLADQDEKLLLHGSPEKDGDIGNWYWVLQGTGEAGIDPEAEHAFTALVGNYPSQILYAGFQGTTTSPVFASSVMQMQMWTPKVELTITGAWDSIRKHFSAHANAHGWFFSADVKARFDELRKSGDIKVVIKVPGNFPGADKVAQQLTERSDLLVDKFMELANHVIFEPVAPKETAAEASSSSSGASPWGFAVALKASWDETHLDLSYHEETQFSHLQTHVVSSSLDGMLQEMAAGGAEAEKKYFPLIYLDDYPHKLVRNCIPIVKWQTGIFNSLSVQLGYPEKNGQLLWEGHVFTRPAAGDKPEVYTYRQAQKRETDVNNPPVGWHPDVTFVKRTVHFDEPDPNDDYVVAHLETGLGTLDIDPGPNGTPVNDELVEVRAESARLASTEIAFKTTKKLFNEDWYLELVLEPVDDKGNPTGGPSATFIGQQADINRKRHWIVYPVAPGGKFGYRYKVTVTDLAEDSEWTSPYLVSNTDKLSVRIPRKNDPGVTFRFRNSQA